MAVKVGLKYIDIWGDSMEDAVCEYEKEGINPGKIVFYGPSYYTRWSAKYGMKPLSEVLRGKSGAECIINRGFGSSCSEHQLYYYPRMVRPLAPKVLVYTFFGNAKAFGYSVEENWELAQRVIAYARTDFPDIKIYLIGAHRKRDKYNLCELGDAKRFDSLLRAFVAETPNCFFASPMDYLPLDRSDIFVDDGVHFNQEGYDIYAEFYKEVLKDELEKY